MLLKMHLILIPILTQTPFHFLITSLTPSAELSILLFQPTCPEIVELVVFGLAGSEVVVSGPRLGMRERGYGGDEEEGCCEGGCCCWEEEHGWEWGVRSLMGPKEGFGVKCA